MELKSYVEKVVAFIGKYKYAVLIVLIGLVLIMIPERSAEVSENSSVIQDDTEESFEDALEEILSKIKGCGNVEVMLTISEGEEVLFQTDDVISGNGENADKRTDTVTVTDTNKVESGLVRQINPPVYRGAIIVCQGADDPVVKLAVTEAVSKITGIGANCISVLKMK